MVLGKPGVRLPSDNADSEGSAELENTELAAERAAADVPASGRLGPLIATG